MSINLPPLKLVVGGATSGKSLFAENLVLKSGLNPVYLATAVSTDEEMMNKIKLHQKRRGLQWCTYECPLNLSEQLENLDSTMITLIECLSTWVGNHMISNTDFDEVQSTLLNVLAQRLGPIVIVTSEVGCGIVPDNHLARSYTQKLGLLNQQIAKMADAVVTITTGIPNYIKGSKPE